MHPKVIVLTGASSGIGAEAAQQLAKQGHTLCLLARNADALSHLVNNISQQGGTAYAYPIDLTDSNAVGSLVAQLLAEHSHIDVLINNAAHSIRRNIQQSVTRLHDYQRTIQLNYLAPVALTLALVPHFVARQQGHVINISTMSSQLPIPLFSAYLGSKAALESFSRSLYAELGDKGIKVSTVYFPMVRTPMSSRTALYTHMRMLSVHKAASWIVQAVTTQQARVASPVGTLSSILTTAMPKWSVDATRPLFARMDKRLAQKLHTKRKG